MKILKSSLSIIFAYFLVISVCNAQKITLKGGLNHQYFSEDIYNIEVPSYEWIRSAPQSNIYNLYEYTNELDRQAAYRFRLGGQLGANISIVDKEKWSIKSGLSIAYNSMSVRQFTLLSRRVGSEIIRQIDVSQPNLENGDSGTVTSTANCNVITNTPNYDNFRPTTQVNFGYLTLPVTVEYHLVKNQISLFTDLFIGTPIFTNSSRDRIYVDWVVENDQTVCTYRNATESASDRDLYQDYTFGVNAGVKLWFGKYGIEASMGRYLQNMFVPHEEQFSEVRRFDKLAGNPTQISLNFLYLLNHEKRSTAEFKEESYFDKEQKKKRKKKKKAYAGAQNLWFSPTAFNLSKGASKYRVIDIVNHSFEYGITDNFSMVGGLNGFPQIAGDLGYLYTSVRAKGTFDISQFVHFGLSLGAAYGFFKDDENLRVINPSAILTLGEPENFLNLSYGYLLQTEISQYSDSNYNNGFHMFSVGGSIKLGRYWSLVSDNLVIIDQGSRRNYIDYLPSLGFKRNNGKNQFDIGLYYYLENNSSDKFPIPIIGYTRFF